MGKKKNVNSSLGKSIIKDRTRGTRGNSNSWRHTSELKDGYDWNCINLNSVTDQNTLDEFLTTAELAGRSFAAEKLNVAVIDPVHHSGLPSAEETKAIFQAQKENKDLLKIPRRPPWDETTTPDELELLEREGFLDWRRQLASLQEKEHVILTPFERNLEFWRQLWRVIERSDVVVQIVDARNPLLFRCEDLAYADGNCQASAVFQIEGEKWPEFKADKHSVTCYSFRPVLKEPDIEKYVKEVNPSKENMILISKADLLTEDQRLTWAEFFNKQGIRVAFWSAARESQRLKQEEEEEQDSQDYGGSESSEDTENEEGEDVATIAPNMYDSLSNGQEGNERNMEELRLSDPNSVTTEEEIDISDGKVTEHCPQDTKNAEHENVDKEINNARTVNDINDLSSPEDPPMGADNLSLCDTKDESSLDSMLLAKSSQSAIDSKNSGEHKLNDGRLLTGEDLLELFKNACSNSEDRVTEGVTTVGLVGYPNVGKSSTINALIQQKKVPVSATPGRTKHFQTLFVEPTLCLCDCPGLVMPSFATSKAEMVVNGILSVDQLRDYVPPVSVVCQTIPREVLEAFYSISIIKPKEGEDQERAPSAMEFLNAYAYTRGLMSHKGVPDCRRAARIVLKDYVNGRLLYRNPPPGISPRAFQAVDDSSLYWKSAQSKPSRAIITEEGTRLWCDSNTGVNTGAGMAFNYMNNNSCLAIALNRIKTLLEKIFQ